MAEEIGFRIRELRESKGVSLAALAEHLNVPPTTLSAWERGVNKLKPSRPKHIIIVQRIAEKLDVAPDDIWHGFTQEQHRTLFENQIRLFVDSLRRVDANVSTQHRLILKLVQSWRKRYPHTPIDADDLDELLLGLTTLEAQRKALSALIDPLGNASIDIFLVMISLIREKADEGKVTQEEMVALSESMDKFFGSVISEIATMHEDIQKIIAHINA